jgi:N-acetylglutamate synthase-like GNAT family acetyltransferase
MRIRKAREDDIPEYVNLARSLDLYYPGLEGDEFWVAEWGGRVVGLVGLKKHPDCLELCALGVDPSQRGKGVAKALVETLLAEAQGDVHLGTIIPDFFRAYGFERAAKVPATFLEKQQTAWCEGCDKRLCTVMVRKVS